MKISQKKTNILGPPKFNIKHRWLEEQDEIHLSIVAQLRPDWWKDENKI